MQAPGSHRADTSRSPQLNLASNSLLLAFPPFFPCYKRLVSCLKRNPKQQALAYSKAQKQTQESTRMGTGPVQVLRPVPCLDSVPHCTWGTGQPAHLSQMGMCHVRKWKAEQNRPLSWPSLQQVPGSVDALRWTWSVSGSGKDLLSPDAIKSKLPKPLKQHPGMADGQHTTSLPGTCTKC